MADSKDRTFQDDIDFDRLVDGELSAAERRELLRSLDGRPDGWRRCALAFLEAQTWRAEVGQLLRDAVAPPRDEKEAAVRAVRYRRPLNMATAVLSVAASLLVAFWLGTTQRGGLESVATTPAPVALDQAQVAAAPDPDTTREGLGEATTLWVRDDTGRLRPMRVPLVDAGTLDRELGVRFRSALPAGMRRELEEQGYDVQSKRRYAPLWLENGRPLIVPVEDTKIVPVGQNI